VKVTHESSHVTHMDESCHIHEGVMSHMRTSRVTHGQCILGFKDLPADSEGDT